MIANGFGGALSAVPTGPGEYQVTWREFLELSERLQRLQRPVEHVTFDERVLPLVAANAQAQPQVAEPLELLGIQQRELRPHRGERRIRLGLIELRLRKLNVTPHIVWTTSPAMNSLRFASEMLVPIGIARPITSPISTS